MITFLKNQFKCLQFEWKWVLKGIVNVKGKEILGIHL